MNSQEMLAALTPEIVSRFREAIETGRWPDGRVLTAGQRQTCIEAVMVWEYHHLPEEQRSGYMPTKQQQLAEDQTSDPCEDEPGAERPVRLI